MKRLGKTTIRNRLVHLSTAISIIAVLLVTTVLALHAYQSRRAALTQELGAIGAILASNLQASLMFQDREAATETLSALSSRALVTSASVVDSQNRIQASYGSPVDVKAWPVNGYATVDGSLLLTVPIVQDGIALGVLKISASLASLDAAVTDILMLSLAILVIAALMSWVLASLLGKAISRPIEHLAQTMQTVSESKDYQQRAARMTDDETGALIDGFNHMIDTIQSNHKDLAEARDRAEKANQSKSHFLATMSHELRTPLNAIMGFSEIIRERSFGDKPMTYSDYARDIHDSAGFLLALINDILDMARLDSKVYSLFEEEIDMGKMTRASVTMIGPQAQAKNLQVETDFEAHGPYLFIDNRGLRQVLLNILGNAVKFTPPAGRITLTAKFNETGDYLIDVSDTGPGIPQADLQRVLQPFEQASSSLSREHGGSGLGLSISAAIMALHGGSLTLSSVFGEGTTASIVIPASRVIDKADGTGQTAEQHRPNIS
ncbi:HAMP domain-containing histidine kinase [Nisaea denitrificans]|uniref:HAMP domain-containing histidine kinase n=1 Tax=Nisaea denitrificans TaxID=390877 RepID=UPI00040CAF39|nr:HAMP domain-containing histidine kinase [Nisaea denitrificans]